MKTLNQVIFEVGKGDQPMTLFATLIDGEEKQITYMNAGHKLPYLCRPSSDGPTLQALSTPGNRLGEGPDWSNSEHTLQIKDGDVILWSTDGLTELEGPDGSQWGDRRLRETLLSRLDHSPDELRDAIVEAALSHRQEGDLADDITLVVGRIAL
jgi:sigma-B regulation protein RsbU (phosphoserine phosphatase)